MCLRNYFGNTSKYQCHISLRTKRKEKSVVVSSGLFFTDVVFHLEKSASVTTGVGKNFWMPLNRMAPKTRHNKTQGHDIFFLRHNRLVDKFLNQSSTSRFTYCLHPKCIMSHFFIFYFILFNEFPLDIGCLTLKYKFCSMKAKWFFFLQPETLLTVK